MQMVQSRTQTMRGRSKMRFPWMGPRNRGSKVLTPLSERYITGHIRGTKSILEWASFVAKCDDCGREWVTGKAGPFIARAEAMDHVKSTSHIIHCIVRREYRISADSY